MVSLLERFQSIKTNSNDVMRVIEEAQVHYGKLIAGTLPALHMAGPVINSSIIEGGLIISQPPRLLSN